MHNLAIDHLAIKKYVNNYFKVLHRDSSARHLRLLKAVHIKLHQRTLCKQKVHFIDYLNLLGGLVGTIFPFYSDLELFIFIRKLY